MVRKPTRPSRVGPSSWLRFAIEPVAAVLLVVWWLLGLAQPVASFDVIPSRSETSLTNVYALLVVVAFGVSLAVSRLSPFLSLSLVLLAVATQLVGWAGRFSQTGWAAYLILLAVVLSLSVHARDRLRKAALIAAAPTAFAVSALLNLPGLSLPGEWGLINGHTWTSPDVWWGLGVWTLAQLIAAAALWRLTGWFHSRRGILLPSTNPMAPTALDALSPREREVYILVAAGLTNAEIAGAAHIEESTVKTHVSNVLAKLGLTSRTAVIAHAYRSGALVAESQVAS
ncbi:MAG: helix-turn-helix transcriptional regulator [Protaetiibacter sp.]